MRGNGCLVLDTRYHNDFNLPGVGNDPHSTIGMDDPDFDLFLPN